MEIVSSLTMIISSSLSYSKDKDIIEFLQNKKKLGISQSSVIKESIRAYMKNDMPYRANSEKIIEQKHDDQLLIKEKMPFRANSEKTISSDFVNNLLG